MHQEPPYRFFHQIGRAVEHVIAEEIGQHVAEYHAPRDRPLPGPRFDALRAVPFQPDRIEDRDLARMVEILETQDVDVHSVAAMFSYPPSLTERELARYKALNRRYVLTLASA